MTLAERFAAFDVAEERQAREGRSARDLARARAAWMRDLIRELWTSAAAEIGVATAPSVVAVGGFGRGELSPRSDIDLLFLSPWPNATIVRRVVDAILYTLWDLKLAVGHAVRAPAESLGVARHDYRSCTALLELDVIAGETVPARRLEVSTKAFVASRRVAFLEENRRAFDERHARFGDTPYLLEPDLKQSPGGLRDVQTAHWAALAQFVVRMGSGLHTSHMTSDRLLLLMTARPYVICVVLTPSLSPFPPTRWAGQSRAGARLLR